MEKYGPERVQRAEAASPYDHGRGGSSLFHHRPKVQGYDAAPSSPPVEAEDVASFLGLPADRLTPELLAALSPLWSELEHAHWRAEQAENRLTWVEQQSDRHAILPCLNRHAFLRDLGVVLAEPQPDGILALISVLGVEAWRHSRGLTAGDGLLRQICGCLVGGLRATDPVAGLGGSDFAVLLLATDRDAARAKVLTVARWISALSPDEGIYPLSVEVGFHDLEAEESAEDALAAADRDRRPLASDP